MNPLVVIGSILGVAAGLIYTSRANATVYQSTPDDATLYSGLYYYENPEIFGPFQPAVSDEIFGPFQQLNDTNSFMNTEVAESANLLAFLKLIREVETNDDYFVINGGDRFTDTSEHPFIVQPNRKRRGTTASGAYQIIRQTWIEVRDKLKLRDFSPQSQDAAAIELLKRRGAYNDVVSGAWIDAINKLVNEWEAFEKMVDGNYHFSMMDADAFLSDNGYTHA